MSPREFENTNVVVLERQPSQCSNTSVTTPRRKRYVSFHCVHVHEHVVVLGDNPSVSSGLPVALGGQRAIHSDIMDIDEYEMYERRHRHGGRGGGSGGSSGGTRPLSKADRAKLIHESNRGAMAMFAVLWTKRQIKRIQRSREESYRDQLNGTENNNNNNNNEINSSNSNNELISVKV